MFLLIQSKPIFAVPSDAHFTFHNVSINTMNEKHSPTLDNTLHSTMFLLIRFYPIQICLQIRSLHSTMFLLIHRPASYLFLLPTSLHSTMFLLIPRPTTTMRLARFFTFHNVSINTIASLKAHNVASTFTFHNVSINTPFHAQVRKGDNALHSTMFLLILRHLRLTSM